MNIDYAEGWEEVVLRPPHQDRGLTMPMQHLTTKELREEEASLRAAIATHLREAEDAPTTTLRGMHRAIAHTAKVELQQVLTELYGYEEWT